MLFRFGIILFRDKKAKNAKKNSINQMDTLFFNPSSLGKCFVSDKERKERKEEMRCF
jgi:hypothetical protein